MATAPQTYQQRRKATGLGPTVRHVSPSEVNRLSSNKRGYDYAWQKYRKVFLFYNPLCVICLVDGILKSSIIVDHVIPHKGNIELFRDPGNHQALCKTCHDIKTYNEDGGFGRPVKSNMDRQDASL